MHTISERWKLPGAAGGRIGAGHFRGPIRVAALRALATLRLWQRRTKQRHALASLDDRILRDLGLSRSEVAWESRKPFWRA